MEIEGEAGLEGSFKASRYRSTTYRLKPKKANLDAQPSERDLLINYQD